MSRRGFIMPVAWRITSELFILTAAASFCIACSLGTKPISCVIPKPEQINSYRLVCTMYFESCNTSLLDIEYTSNYFGTKVSCNCKNKIINGSSISCTVPDLSDDAGDWSEVCLFAPAVQLQYVFILTEYRKSRVSYCVDPRNSVVSMASDAPTPTVIERPGGELDFSWNTRSTDADPGCLSDFNATLMLPWCLSYVPIQYQYRLIYSLQGESNGSGAFDTVATRTWHVKDVSCGERTYEHAGSAEPCTTRLTSLYPGFGYDMRLEREPYAYALTGNIGRRGRAGSHGTGNSRNSSGSTKRDGTCADGFAAKSAIRFSVQLNTSVPTAGVVIDPNGFSVTNCTAQCIRECRLRNESSDISACRSIAVYWKEVPLAKRGGEITRYKVAIDVFNTIHEEFEVAGTAHNISFCHCTSNANTSVSIQPATAEGLGDRKNTTSKIFVPAVSALKPVDELMTKRMNTTTVVLSWRWQYEGHASFAAFWCTSFERNCKDLDWRHLYHVERHRGTDRYHTTLHIPEAGAKELAVAATFGGQAMGIVKPVCSVQLTPKNQLGKLSILVDVLPIDHTRSEPGIRARWNQLSCPEADGLLIGYHLVVCGSYGKRSCTEHRVPPDVSELEVAALHRGTKYSVVLRALVHNGTHVVHSVSSGIETAVTGGISDAVIAGISASAIFGTAVMLIGIAYCTRWLRDTVHTVRRSVDVPIIRRAQPASAAATGSDGYVSCRDSYLLPRSSRAHDDYEEPLPSPIDVDVRCWKVDTNRRRDLFDGVFGWNSGYAEINCTDEYPLLNSPSSLAAQEEAVAAAAAAAVAVKYETDHPGDPTTAAPSASLAPSLV